MADRLFDVAEKRRRSGPSTYTHTPRRYRLRVRIIWHRGEEGGADADA